MKATRLNMHPAICGNFKDKLVNLFSEPNDACQALDRLSELLVDSSGINLIKRAI